MGAMLGGLAGGIGLFLLGMWLMTEGLKLAAGPSLQRVLARSTGTPLRGLASGIAVTALVQSSSAVTVAAIGFVNAGLLTLGQSLWVLFGANVGTTATGWLVALAGLDFKIESASLPLIGVGMVLRTIWPDGRRGALGMAMAGLGVLFVGIDVLRSNFAGLGAQAAPPDLDGGALAVFAFVLMGVVVTVLMQSSSAALALTLTAAQGSMLTLADAAAVVIGANVGTTVTAVLAALGATPNAKRAAAAHVLFNLLTGAMALAMLPWLVGAIVAIRNALALDAAPAATLALFHTTFNVLGVLVMWPMTGALAAFLERRFRSRDEDLARPLYLDRNAAAVPALALQALEREVRRMGGFALRLLNTALARREGRAAEITADLRAASRLNIAIGEFVMRLSASSMSPESVQRLALVLRVARYYDTVAELAGDLAKTGAEADAHAPPAPEVMSGLDDFRSHVVRLLQMADPLAAGDASRALDRELHLLEERYQSLKALLLAAGAHGTISVPGMDLLLREASLTRRSATQACKAARLLDQAPQPNQGAITMTAR